MTNINKTIATLSIFVSLVSADEMNHNFNIGIDTFSGDVKADIGINLGYSYILGDDWKYGLGTNLIIAKVDGETGDTVSFDLRAGKRLSDNVTLYALMGVAGMNTGYKNSSNDDEIAGGAMYGVLCNYTLSDKYDIQAGYKMYDLDYTLNGQKKDYDVQSGSINLVYKF